MSKSYWVCWIFVLVGQYNLCMGVGQNVRLEKNEKATMKMIPPVFESIRGYSGSESACTPPMDWVDRGIRIASPTKIITQGTYRLPVCGSYMFSKRFRLQFKNVTAAMTIVIVDTKTHQSFSTSVFGASDEPPPIEAYEIMPSDEELEHPGGSWFNIDLYADEYIPSLPKRPAKYIIYALLGDQKSNVVEVEIVDTE